MKTFIQHLEYVKDSVQKENYTEIHIVLGNESCDLDSCISSLVLAYHYNTALPKSSKLFVPIQNVSYEHFLLRTDNCFVLKEVGIPLNALIYIDDIDFKKILEHKIVTTTLVDHHVLSGSNKVLEPTVKEVIDHRPIDPTMSWDKTKVDVKIEEVGSCSTLIADKIFETGKEDLIKELAYLIYETIIYDTVALLPQNGKAKQLDIKIVEKIQKMFKFTDEKTVIFDKIWRAHNDVSHLTPKQMLFKDMKVIKTIPVPGLPMLVADFLKIENAYESVKQLAQDLSAPLLLLVGLDAVKEVRRDIAIFFKEESKALKDDLLSTFENCEQQKGYNFCFSEITTCFKDIVCFRQNNIKLSRKQIIPLLHDCLHEKKF